MYIAKQKILLISGATLIAGSLLFVTVNLLSEGRFLNSLFVGAWWNTFTDFFNLLEYVRQGDPYALSSNYTPINFLIIKTLYQLIPQSSLLTFDTPAEEVIALRNSMPPMIALMLMILFGVLVTAFCLRSMLRLFSICEQNLFIAGVLVSGPMLFLFERGNLMFITLGALLIFFSQIDSDKRFLRTIACISLAFASAMKLYPAVFTLLLVRKRRWHDVLLVVIVGLALLLMPFAVFNGIGSIMSFIDGVRDSAQVELGLGCNYSLNNCIRIAIALVLGSNTQGNVFFSFAALLITLCAYVVAKDDWERTLALGIMCIWVPPFSYTYTLLILLPSFVLLIKSWTGRSKYQLLQLIILLALFVPFPTPMVAIAERLYGAVNMPLSWWCVIGNIALCLSCFSIVIRGVVRALTHKCDTNIDT